MRKVLYILGQLSDSDVDWLARAGQRIKVEKGTKIINFGVSLSQVFIVLDGELSVQTNKGFELAKVSSGEILGEMSLVDAAPRSATAVAGTEAKLVPVDRRRFASMIRTRPSFAIEIMRVMADRLRRMDARL